MIRTLSRDECVDFLAHGPQGRAAVSIESLPAVDSLRYSISGDGVVFTAVVDARVPEAAAGRLVAFQVDSFDTGKGFGWSVAAVGRGVEPDDPGDPDTGSKADAAMCLLRVRLARLTGQAVAV